ncbi:extracellular solute-binding protein [Rhizobium sp. BK251]|uniref:ABC transporter substrate-binding protein n=1 Tax=Rhizobium sp. BK251 TaxID=2512125 RepID=UPI0010DB148D|nr:extracellular solute-binding protein [Rhizobium sp. BK251]TCL66432.1 multiple sugar transport system substrate-binding protein [Rhizobium sp. BK251]
MSLKLAGHSGFRIGLAAIISALTLSIFVPPALAQDLSGNFRFTWWGATTRNQKTEEIAKLFEAANPGVKISREPGEFNSYWDKLTVQSASGNQPCAITMQSRWLAQYADPAILRPLDDLVADGTLDVSGVEKTVLDTGRGPDGKLYFIPSGVFYFTLLMNKTQIEAAGLKVPPADWTWDDYAKFVADLSAKLPQGTYATGNLGQAMDGFTNFVQGSGEVLFKPDGTIGVSKDTIARYFTYWESLRKAGDTEPADMMSEIPDNIIDDTLLANGRIAVDARPANQLDAHQKQLAAAKPGEELVLHPYPRGSAGPGDDIGANGFAIGANCNDDSAKLVAAWSNFFLQNEQAADIYLSDNGVVTVDRFREKQLKNPNATAGQRQLIEVYNQVAPQARAAFFPAGGYAAVVEALTTAYESVAFGRATPDDAATAMLDQIGRLIRG